MKYAVSILAILCFAAGAPVEDERIVGGAVAQAGEFPFVVSLTENNRHFCSGFIYSERWIVTTASCIDGKTSNTLKVVVGQLELTTTDTNEEIISVNQIYRFDNYNSTYKFNDVALLKLTKDIDFSTPEFVNFIVYNEVDTTDLTAITMGWGATQEGGLESTKLRYAAVDLESIEATTCGDYTGLEFNRASMLCTMKSADANAGAPCHYDEGSPLIQTIGDVPTVVGIMSKNKGCSVDLPSVYTRVSVYYAWFLQVAGRQPEAIIPTTALTELLDDQAEEAAISSDSDEMIESAWPLLPY